MLGIELTPYSRKDSRNSIKHASKFYFMDLGVSCFLRKIKIGSLAGAEAGKAFEHFICMELHAYNSYNQRDVSLQFWRNKSGREVDFVLDEASIAVETKISSKIDKEDLVGVAALAEQTTLRKAFIVCQENVERRVQLSEKLSIDIVPWKIFLEKLWAGEIF